MELEDAPAAVAGEERRGEVAGGTMELRDGIHPTDANYDLLGECILDLMTSEGMRR